MIRKISIDSINSLITNRYNSGDTLLVLCDASLDNITLTLPDVSDLADIIFFIKKIDASANTITINTVNDQTIDDEASIILSTQYQSEILISDLSEYYKF